MGAFYEPYSKEFYKPYPKEFYAVNDLLPSDFLGEKPHILLNTFDYTNRCVNYNAIDTDKKRFQKEIFRNVIGYLCARKGLVRNYINDHFRSEFENYAEIIEKFVRIGPNSSLSYNDRVDLHYNLVELYHSFPCDPEKDIDGILREIGVRLSRRDTRFKYATIDVVFVDKARWAKMKFHGVDDKILPLLIDPVEDQVFKQEIVASLDDLRILGKCPDQGQYQNVNAKSPEGSGIKSFEVGKTDFFYKYLYPLFFEKDFKGKKEHEIEKFPPWYIVIPIYSADLPHGDFGTVIGHFYLAFYDPKARATFLECSKNELDKLWETWTTLTLRTLLEGRSHLVAEQKLRFHDSLKDFLANITLVQDWERIMVFSGSSDDAPQYCFKRFPGLENKHLDYEQVWDICEKQKDCEDCNHGFHEDLLEVLRTHSPENDHSTSVAGNVYYNRDNNKCFFFQRLGEILDPKILPSIENGDIARYKNYILCFEFPQYTFLPTKSNTEQRKKEAINKLGKHYINKLIPIFDRLLLKRKVLKHSTKSAVAAIMGRNMSHNIGSHVLSYLSDEELTPKKYCEDESLQYNDYIYSLGFYKYLQGRSDYIAEISTTRPIWATQMRLINDVINPFVYSDYRTKKGELLNNIGRSVYGQTDNSLDASKIQIIIRLASENLILKYYYYNHKYISTCVNEQGHHFNCNDSDDPYIDPYIDMPHGLVGCHAFYSILENFLRNSFKHNSDKIIYEILNTESEFKAYIEIDDNIKEHPDLIRVSLHDNVSDYRKDRAKKIQKYIDGEECSLVNKDGSLKTNGGWGIKEMRISSAWLRNISPTGIQSDEAPALLSIGNTDGRVGPEEAGKLCYEFYLLKPLLVLLVDSQCDIKEVPSAGIYKSCSKEEFIDLSRTGKLRHKFVIINDKKTEDWVIANKNKLPSRIFLVGNDSKNPGIFPILLKEQYKKLLTKIKNNEYGVLGKKLYEWWVNYLWGGEMPKIYCVRDPRIVHANISNVDDTAQCTRGSIIFEHTANEMGPTDALYWESYSTSTGVNILGGKMKMIGRDVDDNEIKLKTLYELYEVALANIVIADERIFAKLSETRNIADMNIKIYELLHRWNIDVINLKKKWGGCLTVQHINSSGITKSMKWSRYIENRKVTFFSIHQTIINEITEALFKKDIALSSEIRNVIIHSGRGTVDITPGFKFVEFSNIENSVITKPDKHQLCSLLMNISSL
jgi:hypothetical protein